MLIVSLCIHAQQKNPFTLKGELFDTRIKKIELLYISKDTNFKVDTKVIYPDSKSFTFHGVLPYVYAAYLRFNDTVRSQMFFIEPNKDQHVSIISINKPIKIFGSPVTDEYENSFLPQLTSIDFKIDSLYTLFRRFSSNLDSSVSHKEKIREDANRLKSIRRDILYNYLKEHHHSYVSLWALYFEVMVRGYHSALEDAFGLLPSQFQNNPIGVETKRNLENSLRLTSGKLFPILKLRDTSNRWIELPMTQKFTLIDFWFSNCAPCIAQFEQLKSIYESDSSKGFGVIGISIEDDLTIWKNAIKEHQLSWLQLLDFKGAQSSRMTINAFPANFLIDENGRIIRKNITLEELKVFLDREL